MESGSGAWGAALLLAACGLAGCGYVGEPEPPLLNIPGAVQNLGAAQIGERAAVTFSLPPLSTEGFALREPAVVELRAGPAPVPFDAGVWEAGARPYPVPPSAGDVEMEIPVEEWSGKEILIAVRSTGANGRSSGWSNFARLQVVPAPLPPTDLKAEPGASGVRLSWTGSARSYRVLRKGAEDADFEIAGDTQEREFLDKGAEFGKAYFYRVESLVLSATGLVRSRPSGALVVEPVDRFAPPPPAGVTAVAGSGSVELLWERSTAADLALYRVYRSEGGGPAARLAETGEAASYSDRTAASGRSYRYTVTAVDRMGNESAPSEPAMVTAP